MIKLKTLAVISQGIFVMEKTVLKFHGRGDHLKLVRVTDTENNHTIYRVEFNRKILWAGEWIKTATIKFRSKAWELMSQEELPGLEEAAAEAAKNALLYNPINSWKKYEKNN